MDPNATLRDLHEAIVNREHDEVVALCDHLSGWARRGGFLPAEWDDERLPEAERRIRFGAWLSSTRSAHTL